MKRKRILSTVLGLALAVTLIVPNTMVTSAASLDEISEVQQNTVVDDEYSDVEEADSVNEILKGNAGEHIKDELNNVFEKYLNKKAKHEKSMIRKSIEDIQGEWNLQMINTTNSFYTPSEKVKVALIDSGVDYSTDIDVAVRKNFISEQEEISIIYEDLTGHGTSVAGIIAAKDNNEGITGINPNVELYSARVLDENLSAPISRVVDAIYWAIDQDVN